MIIGLLITATLVIVGLMGHRMGYVEGRSDGYTRGIIDVAAAHTKITPEAMDVILGKTDGE